MADPVQARLELRRKLGLDATQPAKAQTLKTVTQSDTTVLPDGLEARISEARKQFIQTITPKDSKQ